MRLAGIWGNSTASPSQAGPSVKRGLKGPATDSKSHAIVPSYRWLYNSAQEQGSLHVSSPHRLLSATGAIEEGEGGQSTAKSSSGSQNSLTRDGVVLVPVADHVLGIQVGDLCRRVAEQTAQHLLVVLAHF